MHQSERILVPRCNSKVCTEVFHLDSVKHHTEQRERHKSAYKLNSRLHLVVCRKHWTCSFPTRFSCPSSALFHIPAIRQYSCTQMPASHSWSLPNRLIHSVQKKQRVKTTLPLRQDARKSNEWGHMEGKITSKLKSLWIGTCPQCPHVGYHSFIFVYLTK